MEADVGEPCAGERRARFDGRALETEQSRPPNMAVLEKPRDLNPDLLTTRHRASARPYSSPNATEYLFRSTGADHPHRRVPAPTFWAASYRGPGARPGRRSGESRALSVRPRGELWAPAEMFGMARTRWSQSGEGGRPTPGMSGP